MYDLSSHLPTVLVRYVNSCSVLAAAISTTPALLPTPFTQHSPCHSSTGVYGGLRLEDFTGSGRFSFPVQHCRANALAAVASLRVLESRSRYDARRTC